MQQLPGCPRLASAGVPSAQQTARPPAPARSRPNGPPISQLVPCSIASTPEANGCSICHECVRPQGSSALLFAHSPSRVWKRSQEPESVPSISATLWARPHPSRCPRAPPAAPRAPASAARSTPLLEGRGVPKGESASLGHRHDMDTPTYRGLHMNNEHGT